MLLLLLICFPIFLHAQEGSDAPSIEEDWDFYETDTYTFGDQAFAISIGTIFPVVFLNNGNVIDHQFSPPIGGSGILSYAFFLGANFFVGAEVGFNFLPTLANSTAFIVPVGLRAGFQFSLWRFEFPITVTVGVNWHSYLDLSYFGLYMKGGIAAYYKYNLEWSFGMSASWGWYPEWTSERHKNIDGNIVDIMLSARYHF
jgi:hypothetical protein